MKALIIGGGGFVGPYLAKHLTEDLEYTVRNIEFRWGWHCQPQYS